MHQLEEQVQLMSDQIELVTLTIDGIETKVPKGTNLIEAALGLGIEIPFYCYHKHLSIAGNCRMCQVHVEGSPKLTIGCNTTAANGMVVKTQKTSSEVEEAQRATLEFLLINHPLDCTVCDQAGHCKLQDYYFEYNKKASRFIEEKTEKVKAEVLGPEVVYDGERCIVCTRCVRFCDEVTETGELSVLNRGDRTVIAIHEDKPLDNPFSGTTVDLCPVGALTHRQWRFNSRIWYSRGADTICTGCSTGCNVQVAVRDNQIVQVKGRLNSEVNKEWMCDEGRYGFGRFQPESRLEKPLVRRGQYLEELEWTDALISLKSSYESASKSNADVLFLVSPFLTLEEMWTSFNFAEKLFGVKPNSDQIAVQLKTRSLTDLEKILISEDYAPNARSAQVLGYLASSTDWRKDFQSSYERALTKIKHGLVKTLVVIGDRALLDEDLDENLIAKILEIPFSLALSPRSVIGQSDSTSVLAKDEQPLGVHQLSKFILPTVTVNEKNGIFVNRDMRLQKLNKLLEPPRGVMPEWTILKKVAEVLGKPVLPLNINDDRALFLEMASKVGTLEGMTLREIGSLGSNSRQQTKTSQSSLESSI
jgi:NADH-quinone oxidoreductase subunit G